jgi:hypothetical protein
MTDEIVIDGTPVEVDMSSGIVATNDETRLVTGTVGRAAQAIMGIRDMLDVLAVMRKEIFIKDIDYAVVPGTDKPSLMKPGAEKLCNTFSVYPKYNIIHAVRRDGSDGSEPYYYYEIECTLHRISDNAIVGTGIGVGNSWEGKYRWRWVSEDRLPAKYKGHEHELESRSGMISEFAFSIDKAETTGQYGKPKEYWDNWKKAIEVGAARKTTKKTKTGKVMDAWEMGGTEYQIPNPDIFSQINTVVKMTEKRALIAAVLVAFNASQFFTQDIEEWVVSDANADAFNLILPKR